jgi:hypothetical protein
MLEVFQAFLVCISFALLVVWVLGIFVLIPAALDLSRRDWAVWFVTLFWLPCSLVYFSCNLFYRMCRRP